MSKYCGIDIGGTGVKLGLFDGTTLLEKRTIPTDRSDGGTHILTDIVRALPEGAVAAGIGVPGAVLPDGTVNRCVNLGWGVCRPGEEFTALTGLPCRVCNDANAAALGEQWQGAGAGYRSLLMVTLGTGVGGGLVLDGNLVTGAHGAAGEIGHLCVNPEEPEHCACGRKGCLEQYASATGITRLAGKAGLGAVTAREVFDQAREGEEEALALVDEVCDILGRGLAAACTVVNPEAIVLGGGVARAGEILRARVEEAYRRSSFHACRETAILLSALGSDAGLYGAARYGMLKAGCAG